MSQKYKRIWGRLEFSPYNIKGQHFLFKNAVPLSRLYWTYGPRHSFSQDFLCCERFMFFNDDSIQVGVTKSLLILNWFLKIRSVKNALCLLQNCLPKNIRSLHVQGNSEP